MVKSRKSGDQLIVYLSGEIDHCTAERLRGEGKRVIFEAGLDEDEKRRYSETEDIGEIITVEGGEMKCR